MKRKIVFGYWFYNLCPIVGIGLYLALLIVVAIYSDVLWLLIPLVLGLIVFVIIGCHLLFQFTVFTEDGIKTRAIWHTIRSLKWEEVKEVRYERFYVSVKGGFTNGWYVFDDGVERKQYNGLVNKNSHIAIRATKRARKTIETFWHNPIVEKEIK